MFFSVFRVGLLMGRFFVAVILTGDHREIVTWIGDEAWIDLEAI